MERKIIVQALKRSFSTQSAFTVHRQEYPQRHQIKPKAWIICALVWMRFRIGWVSG